MITGKDVAWLAGIIEGDGCIGYTARTINVGVDMSDKDVVNRVAALMGVNVTGPYIRKTQMRPINGAKPIYTARCYGTRAAGVLMSIYSFLGHRRKAKAKEVLAIWRQPLSKYSHKLGIDKARQVLKRYRAGETIRALAKDYCTDYTTIHAVVRGQTYMSLQAE